MKKNVQIITISAVTLALTIILGLFPFVFLVPLLFTCVTRDWKMSLLAALFFGVVSYLYSFMGNSIVAVAFLENPWIPIVPRLAVGLIAHGSYVLMRKVNLGKGKLNQVLPVSVAASVGSIANTALIITCLVLFAPNATFGTITMPLYVSTMLISGVVELVAVNVVIPPLAIIVGKALKLEQFSPRISKNIYKKESHQN